MTKMLVSPDKPGILHPVSLPDHFRKYQICLILKRFTSLSEESLSVKRMMGVGARYEVMLFKVF